MEDLEAREVHSGEMKASSEKSIKRKYKTPGQIEALEKFYNEHKYPTEELKLQFAEQVGLTEKQVSGWFCHRRLKDRRLQKDETYANGRQDHSSGVIQDHGSGLRQDSCGSTKQGDHLLVEPKEVESRSFQRRNSPAMNIINEHREQYMGNAARMDDDTSSGSSSPLHDRFFSPRPESEKMKSSKHLTRNGVNATNDFSNNITNVGYRPSGYLKVKRQTENPAITAVKRQLGEHYHKEGPPLGIEFDPLPPGAFESPSRDASPRSYYGGVASRSPEIPRKWKAPTITAQDSAYDSEYEEGTANNALGIQDHHDYQSQRKSKEKQSYHNQANPYNGLNPSFDEQEDSPDHVSIYSGKKKKYSISSKEKEEMVSPSYDDRHYPFARDSVPPKEHQFHDRAEIRTKDALRGEKSRLAASKPKSRGTNYFDGEKNKPFKTEKEGNKFLEKMVATDQIGPARIRKQHPNKEFLAAKRVKTELPLQDYATKPSVEMHH